MDRMRNTLFETNEIGRYENTASNVNGNALVGCTSSKISQVGRNENTSRMLKWNSPKLKYFMYDK